MESYDDGFAVQGTNVECGNDEPTSFDSVPVAAEAQATGLGLS